MTVAMTVRNSLSFKLIEPTGEQAIVRNIPDGSTIRVRFPVKLESFWFFFFNRLGSSFLSEDH